jgi:flavorubredoxin
MFPEKMKSELKRFLTPDQIEEISKQWEKYESRLVEAKQKGKQQVDRLSVQWKNLVNQEGKVLKEGIAELVSYFRDLSKAEAPKKKKTAKRARKPSTRKPTAAAN